MLQFALYQPRSGVRLPYPRLPAGTAVVLALVLLNVVSQWAARRKDDRVLLRTGRLDTQKATDFVIEELQNELGKDVVIKN